MNNSFNTISNTWEDLPNEILEIIAKHLQSRIDVFRFRAVSTSWRSAIPLPNNRKSLITLPQPRRPLFLFPSQSTAVLVKVVEYIRGKLKLVSPLSHFPRQFQGNYNYSRKTINLLDFRLIEIDRGYHLADTKKLKKVVLFYDLGLLALFDLGKLRLRGFGVKEWTDLGNIENNYDDIMSHNNQFYVINNLGTVYWIDKCRNLVQYSPPLYGNGQFKNLVVSEGQFYIVDYYMEEEVVAGGQPALFPEPGVNDRRRIVDMKVYKLNEDWGTWVGVKSLDDRVFVLGKEVCVSVSVKDFPGCQGNCIYFIDASDPKSESKNLGGTIKRFVGRVYLFDNGSIQIVECFPAYNRLFSPDMNWPIAISS